MPSTTYSVVLESLELCFAANAVAVALGVSEGVAVKTGAGVLVELLVGLLVGSLVGLLVEPESGKVPFKLALELVASEPSQV